MKEYKLEIISISMFAYFGLSFILFFLLGNGIQLWLGINVFLAFVPVLLISFVHYRLVKKHYEIEWLSIILFVAFVFFFPNALFVITDLIHLQSVRFVELTGYGFDETESYLRNIGDYIFLAHVAVTVLLGSYAGIRSMLIFKDVFNRIGVKENVGHIIFGLLIVSSSVGIYIGRFLRFFSWDILNPFKVLAGLSSNIDGFAIWFIILFIIIHYSLFYGYKLLRNEEPF